MTPYNALVAPMYTEGMGYDSFFNQCQQSSTMNYYHVDTQDLYVEYEAGRWPNLKNVIPFEYMLLFLFSSDRYQAILEAMDTFLDDTNGPPDVAAEYSQIELITDKCLFEIDNIYKVYMPVFLTQLPTYKEQKHVHITPDEQMSIHGGLSIFGYSTSEVQGLNAGGGTRVLPRKFAHRAR